MRGGGSESRPLVVRTMPLMRVAALLLLTAGLAACGAPPAAPAPRYVRAWRTVGTWEGSGNALMGNVNSETGQFRITWDSRPAAAAPGAFTLIVRSAVSGRTLDVIADGPGDSRGTADFVDTPRVYDFQVDANGAQWTVTVEEAYAAPAATP
jgi:hypothetical protein